MVDASYLPGLMIPYTALLKHGVVVNATVEKVSKTEIYFAEGSIKFDYLVIATGSSYSFPLKVEAASPQPLYDDVAAKIKTAKNVVVVGAGSTGLEVAAEIKETYNVNVTIVFSTQRVMPGPWTESFRQKLEAHLKKMEIQLISDDRIQTDDTSKWFCPPEGKVTTEKGKELDCDLLFWCVGGKINSTVYEDTFPMTKASLNVNDSAEINVLIF